eukprot:scaffold5873_cov105-Isochrysis_galbana.AAC.1
MQHASLYREHRYSGIPEGGGESAITGALSGEALEGILNGDNFASPLSAFCPFPSPGQLVPGTAGGGFERG